MTAPPSLVMVNAVTQRIDYYTMEASEESLVQAARKAIADPEHYGAAWLLGPDGWEVEIDIISAPVLQGFWMIKNHVSMTACTLYRRGIQCSEGNPTLIVRVMPRMVGHCSAARYAEMEPLERAVAWALLETEP